MLTPKRAFWLTFNTPKHWCDTSLDKLFIHESTSSIATFPLTPRNTVGACQQILLSVLLWTLPSLSYYYSTFVEKDNHSKPPSTVTIKKNVTFPLPDLWNSDQHLLWTPLHTLTFPCPPQPSPASFLLTSPLNPCMHPFLSHSWPSNHT